MEPSREQEVALERAGTWLDNATSSKTFREEREQIFRLFGPAGVGKTSIAKRLAELSPGRVHFAAFTGKAAHVMRAQGGVCASTIHSLIYRPKEKSREHLSRLLAALEDAKNEDEDFKARLAAEIKREEQNLTRPSFSLNLDSELNGASLLIVDECSMVDHDIANDLMSFKVPILVLGDPFQLPPVFGQGYFINAQPDYLLSQVHRQALDSPVYAMATELRENGRLSPGPRGESGVFPKQEISTRFMAAADQVLVGRNATRMTVNDRIRKLNGIQHAGPVAGDKLVCLRNNNDIGIFNGSMWRCLSVDDVYPDTVDMTLQGDIGDPMGVTAHMEPFFTGEKKRGSRFKIMDAECFTYGYALTVHKAQGSQWPNVLVCDESWVFAREKDTPARWLYTAITRASETAKVYR